MWVSVSRYSCSQKRLPSTLYTAGMRHHYSAWRSAWKVQWMLLFHLFACSEDRIRAKPTCYLTLWACRTGLGGGATFWQFKKQLATMTIQQRLASLLLLLNDYCHVIVQKAQPGNYLKWHTRHRQCCCAPFARSTMACYPKITHWPLFGSVWTNKASMKKGLRQGQCCLTSV